LPAPSATAEPFVKMACWGSWGQFHSRASRIMQAAFLKRPPWGSALAWAYQPGNICRLITDLGIDASGRRQAPSIRAADHFGGYSGITGITEAGWFEPGFVGTPGDSCSLTGGLALSASHLSPTGSGILRCLPAPTQTPRTRRYPPRRRPCYPPGRAIPRQART
jgi:hypothetical protein